MITSLKLENFRAFTELTVAPLKRINLLAGANNTGKTGILEALFLLFGDHAQLQKLPSTFRSTLSSQSDQISSDDFVTFWQALFYDKRTELASSIGAQAESKKTSTCRINSNGIAILITHPEHVHDQRPYSYMIGPEGRLNLQIQNPFALNFIALSTRLERPDKDAELYNQVTFLEGGEERLLQLLREIDPRLKNIRYAKPPGTSQPLVYASFGLKNSLTLSQTGQGFSKLFSLFCQMIVSKAKVLLIDEIENGLYYEALPLIWKGIATLAASEDIQVFATTHSRECLIAAHETMKAQPSYDFALHRLQRVNGKIEAVTHDKEMLEVALKTGLEVR